MGLVYRMLKVKSQWRFVLGEHKLPTLDFGLLGFRDTVVRLKCEVGPLVSK